MRVSELVTRLTEQQAHVGDVAVALLLSSDWEDWEGPVTGVKTVPRPFSLSAVCAVIDGRVAGETEERLKGAAGADGGTSVAQLIAQLVEHQERVGDAELKLEISGDGYGGVGAAGPITDVRATRRDWGRGGGPMTTTTGICISGPIES